MILFIFEGGKSEPLVFESLRRLFLTEEVRVVICEHDLPTLYSKLKRNDYDLFRSLPLEKNGIDIPNGVRIDTLFSQIFLFFDYDFQNRIGLKKVNEILDEMLDFFDDETANGKLYVNYPMIESLKYTKELPDCNYVEYTATREECMNHKFKGNAESFAYPEAKQYRFIDLSKSDALSVKNNWNMLMQQNVSKANYIAKGDNKIPLNKEDVCQVAIYKGQISNYVNEKEMVAILNSFPLFLFEYFKTPPVK